MITRGTDEQQLRRESEQNLVQIVTIHKSKGLEYPVCFVPFVSLARDNRRRPTPMLYHRTNDAGEQELVWDIEGTDEVGTRQTRNLGPKTCACYMWRSLACVFVLLVYRQS